VSGGTAPTKSKSEQQTYAWMQAKFQRRIH
jgi:hypothetical protein